MYLEIVMLINKFHKIASRLYLYTGPVEVYRYPNFANAVIKFHGVGHKPIGDLSGKSSRPGTYRLTVVLASTPLFKCMASHRST